MRYALIRNGVVDNICEWDGDESTWGPPAGVSVIAAPDHVGVGWTYNGEAWAPPASAPRFWIGHPLRFKDLFTGEERARWRAVRRAEEDLTPEAMSEPANALLVTFGDVMDSFDRADAIDTREPSVGLGLDVLIALGVIAPERKQAILEGETP